MIRRATPSNKPAYARRGKISRKDGSSIIAVVSYFDSTEVNSLYNLAGALGVSVSRLLHDSTLSTVHRLHAIAAASNSSAVD